MRVLLVLMCLILYLETFLFKVNRSIQFISMYVLMNQTCDLRPVALGTARLSFQSEVIQVQVDCCSSVDKVLR